MYGIIPIITTKKEQNTMHPNLSQLIITAFTEAATRDVL